MARAAQGKGKPTKMESQHECFPEREPDYYVNDDSQDYLRGANALLRARGS
jgi:hypothetical protein